MSRNLTASDRSSLIRLASSLPAGSAERKAILAGLTKTSSLLTPDLEAAARIADVKVFASLLDAKYGDDAYLFLDDMSGELRPVLTGVSLREFRTNVDKVLYKFREVRENAAIAASPWKKELRALAEAFGTTVTPKDVRSIKYQPKLSKGVVVGAILEDIGDALGHMRTSIDEKVAVANGTNLKKVFLCLEDLGAKLVTRGMGPGKPKPWIDYDGWAY